jgi:hypothetical protein
VEVPDFSIADEIRKLAELRQQGVLSDEEFQTERGRLLGQPPAPTASEPADVEAAGKLAPASPLHEPATDAPVPVSTTEATGISTESKVATTEAAVTAQTPPTPDTPPPDSSGPLYKKWWLWAASGLVLIVIIVAVVVALNGKTPSPHRAAASSTSGTSPYVASSTTTPTTTAVPAPSVPPSFGGTAHPTFSAGAPGSLDVIYVATAFSQGSGDGTIVPVEVWNGTSQTVSGLDISGSAMTGSTVVGSGDSQDVEPGVLAPGQVAFGMVFYTQNLPSGATFNLTATASTGSSDDINAQVTQANYSATGGIEGPGVVGTVTNPGSVSISSPIPTDLFCFSSSGTLLNVSEDFVAGNASLAPGATGSYSVGIPLDENDNPLPCPTFLVGSSGTTD